MYGSGPRKARIYDRLEGEERLAAPRRRFAEVDAALESLRPGAVVALVFECDELLAARRSANTGAWSLATVSTDWSSRGSSGWHTHAGDYAVESLEPEALFRVMRDGRRIALASLAADGLLLCASATADRLALGAPGSGGWSAAGASWEQADGAIRNTRWPDKVLAVRLLHVTCLPTTQLQRVEEFFGGLMHELHAEKSAAQKLVLQAEQQRDAAVAEARRWRQELAAAEDQAHALRGELAAAKAAAAQRPGGEGADVALQLAALQQQLEGLAAEGGLAAPQQQERARMSICLRTIKDITDLVRRSSNATPRSSDDSGDTAGPSLQPPSCSLGSADSPEPDPPGPYATATEGESRLRDYLGSRPEEGDPLERVLQPALPAPAPSSPPRRALQALALASQNENEGGSGAGSDGAPTLGGSAPPTCRKQAAANPLLASLSAAVSQLAAGSPRQADGVAQFMATRGSAGIGLRASHPQPAAARKRASPMRASAAQAQPRSRSSFLKRAPAAAEDLYYRC